MRETLIQRPTFKAPVITPREDDDEEIKFEARFSTHPNNQEDPKDKKRVIDRSQSLVVSANPNDI